MLRDAALPVQPAEANEDEGEHGFGGDYPTVIRRKEMVWANAQGSIDDAGNRHDRGGEQRQTGIAANGKCQVLAEAARVRDQGGEPADPQHHEHQVPEVGICAPIVVTTRCRVAFHTQRNDGEYRADEQDWLHGPATCE